MPPTKVSSSSSSSSSSSRAVRDRLACFVRFAARSPEASRASHCRSSRQPGAADTPRYSALDGSSRIDAAYEPIKQERGEG